MPSRRFARYCCAACLLPLSLAACPGPTPTKGEALPALTSHPPRAMKTKAATSSAPARAPASVPARAPTGAPTSRVRRPVLPTGSLSRADIMQVVRRSLPAVRYCYERELIKQPTLAGRLLVSMVVQEDGRVREAVVEHSSIDNPTLDACVIDRVSTWRFPRPRGGLVVIKYPFIFRTSKP